MDRRFVQFLVVAAFAVAGFIALRAILLPPTPPPVAKKPEDDKQGKKPEEKKPGEKNGEEKKGEGPKTPDPAAPAEAPEPTEPSDERITLGSLNVEKYRMLVTLHNLGASIERVELNDPQYHDIADRPEDDFGYLGHLGLQPSSKGCKIGVVGAGTPAEAGRLQVDDVILSGKRLPDGDVHPTPTPADFVDFQRTTHAGDTIELEVERPGATPPKFTAKIELTHRPMQVVRPSTVDASDVLAKKPSALKPASYLTTLSSFDGDEPADVKWLSSLTDGHWKVSKRPTLEEPVAEFERQLTPRDWKRLGIQGDLKVVKRYSLAKIQSDKIGRESAAYHLTMEIEIQNLGKETRKVMYRQDGPTGLPEEGWQNASKVHPSYWSGAGTRDVVWRSVNKPQLIITANEIATRARDSKEDPTLDIGGAREQMQYAGVDAIYFSAAMLAEPAEGQPTENANYSFSRTRAQVIGRVITEKLTRSDVSFQLTSMPLELPAEGSFKQRFVLFHGPKDPTLLSYYGLDDFVVYGWFAPFAKLLLWFLHAFYFVTRNYGLAIILLTVMVRLATHFISRKTIINAQVQQELAPEVAKIKEEYPEDPTKQWTEMQKLYGKYGVDQLAGCIFMPLQMPIFIGLYRGLAVDVSLRQASLIPGLHWCSNLAGPDQLWYWQPYLEPLGLGFLVGEYGYLGPWLNILPLLTMVLFLWQSKQMQAPPTDEQQEAMQNVSTMMMVMMSFFFYKVASGLCLYFIVSSLWGIGEKYYIGKIDLKKLAEQNAQSQQQPEVDVADEIEAKKARARKR